MLFFQLSTRIFPYLASFPPKDICIHQLVINHSFPPSLHLYTPTHQRYTVFPLLNSYTQSLQHMYRLKPCHSMPILSRLLARISLVHLFTFSSLRTSGHAWNTRVCSLIRLPPLFFSFLSVFSPSHIRFFVLTFSLSLALRSPPFPTHLPDSPGFHFSASFISIHLHIWLICWVQRKVNWAYVLKMSESLCNKKCKLTRKGLFELLNLLPFILSLFIDSYRMLCKVTFLFLITVSHIVVVFLFI